MVWENANFHCYTLLVYLFFEGAIMSSLHPFVAETLRNLHVTPEEAALGFAIVKVQEQIRDCEMEIHTFEAKYQMSFEDFSKRMEARQNEEIFEESDDWNDWRSSIEFTIILKKRLAALTTS
jgi:hypothetical protein